MSDLVEFLRARLLEDEWWALEASRLQDQEGAPAGDHWQWETYDDDDVCELNPARHMYVGEDRGTYGVSLRSKEQYPTESVGMLPNFAISNASEVPIAAGGHIVRHDPARVLRDVAASRRTVDRYERLAAEMCASALDEDRAWVLLPTLIDLASVHASHPDYREEWKA